MLQDAALSLREAAAEHTYRADAMKFIRERHLERYHRDQAVLLQSLARDLQDLRTWHQAARERFTRLLRLTKVS